MSADILPGYLPSEQRGDHSDPHFKYAVIAAVLVELGIVFGLMSIPQAPPTPKPMKKVVSVHMVTLPQPTPKITPPQTSTT